MQIEKPLIEGRLVRRYKRFLADVELEGGEVVTAHCPNPGRLIGCIPEGARVVLRDSQDPARKLRHTFQTVRIGRHWVNVDTSLPNAIVAEAIAAGGVPELTGYANLRREVAYGERSRIDILLEDERRGRCWVEVKCTTLLEDGAAKFPDAVTARGLKHLRELERVVRDGDRAVMFFFVSRGDAERFEPADAIDPDYGAALREALAAGVEALVYSAHVSPERIDLQRRLELVLPKLPAAPPLSKRPDPGQTGA